MKYIFWAILVIFACTWLWLHGNEPRSAPLTIEKSTSTASVVETAPQGAPKSLPSKLSTVNSILPLVSPASDYSVPGKPPETMPAPYVVDPLGILRGEQGDMVTMSQEAATQACKERGMHLPTIHELVNWSNQLLGQRDRSGRSTPEPIHASNPDGKDEEFTTYYDSSGHGDSFPQDDWGKKWFRSSSKNADNPSEYFSLGIGNGYVSSGENRDPDYRNVMAVRCASEEKKPR